MASMEFDLISRVKRLPRPTNVAGALLPIFEAVSNSIHATQARFGDQVATKGVVHIVVEVNRNKDAVTISVQDNGTGLNKKNWKAFRTADTGNKIEIGGKGVGRLLWLSAFEGIKISSVYNEGASKLKRDFRFVLSNDDQIQDYEEGSGSGELGTYIAFSDLKVGPYRSKFPGRGNFIFQHLVSHFLPVFVGGRSPQINVQVNDDSKQYPKAIDEIVLRRENPIEIQTDEYGDLEFTQIEADKVSSSDLKGTNFIHFIAHDRTVHSQCIDGKLGLKAFGSDDRSAFHGLLKGDFLDQNVNQERTAFVFEDKIIDDIVGDVCYPFVAEFLAEPLTALSGKQKKVISSIISKYPSVAFGPDHELQSKVPPGELKADAIYGHLSRQRFRRDEKQAEKVRHALGKLKSGVVDSSEFFDAIQSAAEYLEEAERKSLAELVVRRKVILDFMAKLLERVRLSEADSAFQTENLLHTFICPVRVNSVHGGERADASSHDLWIVDERLTFAKYFSSDVEFQKILEGVEDEDRADLILFDHVHALKVGEETNKVMLVEFKRPGRKGYNDDENPQHQIERYVRKLTGGKVRDIKGRPIDLDKNTIFYCFIVADVIGKMDDWTFSWRRTVDGRGRVYRPDDGFNGSVELISWDALISDAHHRNRAYFESAGLPGDNLFDSSD